MAAGCPPPRSTEGDKTGQALWHLKPLSAGSKVCSTVVPREAAHLRHRELVQGGSSGSSLPVVPQGKECPVQQREQRTRVSLAEAHVECHGEGPWEGMAGAVVWRLAP